MKEENLLMFSVEELPETDEAKPKKISINQLSENFRKLMDRDKVELAEVKEETSIAWTTIWGWYKGDVTAQILDVNVKELADYFDVSINFLAFGDVIYVFDTFDKQELYKLKDAYEGKIKNGIYW